MPSFSISTNNIGLQLADLIAYVLGKRCINPKKIMEFEQAIKKLEFKSRKRILVDGKEYPVFGFKDIATKKNEAGDLFDPGRA